MGPGSVVADRFEIERTAGSGGMGKVFRARDRVTGAVVALKIPHRFELVDVARFTREADTLAQLTDPRIVRYVAHGIDDRVAYLATEWLEGESLGDRLERGALSVEDALLVVRDVARGLAHAHARGIVHRDLKPSNLFLVGGSLRDVRILDFGIARRPGADTLTLSNAVLGTPLYMAPEQARSARDADARADVHSLGAVLFRCIAGRAPFEDGSGDLEALLRVAFDEAPSLRSIRGDVPAAVSDLVAQLLARDREARPDDAGAVADRLDQLLEDPTRPVRIDRVSTIGIGERRLLSMILARAPVGEDLEPALRSAIDERFAAREARLDVLADGTATVRFFEIGAATRWVERAAAVARAVIEGSPRARVVIVVGRADATDSGDTPELIARARALLDDTDDGEIRVDAVTARLLDTTGDLDRSTRGDSWRVRTGASERRSEPPRRARVLGRDKELALLRATLEECVGEPVARALVVVGPAGIGKSRLTDELVATARDRGATIWTATGDPLAGSVSLGALATALREWIGIAAPAPLSARRDAIARRLEPILRRDPACTIEFLSELVGAPPDAPGRELRAARRDPRLMADQLQNGLEVLACALAQRGPLVIVADDAQWIDPATIRALDALLRRAQDLPLLALAVGRPEIDEVHPALWADRGAQPIRLGPLTKASTRALAAALLGPEATPERVERVCALSQGHPFAIEELARAGAAGRAIEVPESVLALAEHRLLEQGGAARRVLRAASTFGETFEGEGALALLGGADARGELATSLRDLEARGLIVAARRGTDPIGGGWRFSHSLLREAAYASFTDDDRAIAHRLAGRFLADAPEADPAIVAEHFLRGGTAPTAIPWLLRAAERALDRSDFDAVLALTDRALGAGAERDARGRLHRARAIAHRWRGELGKAGAEAELALALLVPRTPAWRDALRVAVRAYSGGTHRDAFEVVAQRAISDATEPSEGATLHPDATLDAFEPDANDRAAMLADVAAGYLFLERADQAERVFALLPADREGLRPDVRAAIDVARVVQSLYALHSPELALEASLSAIDAFTEAGDRRSAMMQRGNVGYLMIELGQLGRAEDVLRKMIADAEERALPTVVAGASQNLALALTMLGRTRDARPFLARARAHFEAHQNARMLATCDIYGARLELLDGNAHAALELAQRALELAPTPSRRTYARATIVEARIALGDLDVARAEARIVADELASAGDLDEGDAFARLACARATGDRTIAREGAARVDARAAKIRSDEARAAFLHAIPEHVGLRALA